ncbi:MAG TPA: AI-2E family transporter [Polyangiales bacterium]|nr:AI-2E family transporter [Polyangiales bacterium]
MADSTQSSPFGSTSLVVRAAAMVVLLGALKLATQLVVPLLLAAFLAIASAPLMFWLIRRGVNRFVAVGAAVLADVAFFAAMFALSARGLDAFVSAVPRYQARVEVLRLEASEWLVAQGLPDLGELLPSALRGESARRIVATAFTEVFNALSMLALVLLIVAFLLVELLGIEEKLRLLFKHPELGIEQFRRAAAHVQLYILVKSGANLLTGILVALWLAAFRVDFALLWGVLAFMLSYIPTIGSLLLAVPVLTVTLLQYGFGTALVVGVGYVLINTAIAALVEPRVFGQALGLSPLVVFVSMVCWGWLWGPIGAVLSVPLTVVVKIALAYVEGYEWLAGMLGPVVGMSGVGTPSVPPVVFTSLPPSVVATTSISLSGRPSSGSQTGSHVVIPISPPTPTISTIGGGKPAYATPSSPSNDDDRE